MLVFHDMCNTLDNGISKIFFNIALSNIILPGHSPWHQLYVALVSPSIQASLIISDVNIHLLYSVTVHTHASPYKSIMNCLSPICICIHWIRILPWAIKNAAWTTQNVIEMYCNALCLFQTSLQCSFWKYVSPLSDTCCHGQNKRWMNQCPEFTKGALTYFESWSHFQNRRWKYHATICPLYYPLTGGSGSPPRSYSLLPIHVHFMWEDIGR